MMDTTNNIGSIQSAQSNVSNLPLCLNPIGGNVGIGTTTPLTTLHVNGSTFLSKATFIGPNYGISATNGGIVPLSSTQLFVSGGSFNNNNAAAHDGGQFIIADNTQTKYRLGLGVDITNSVAVLEGGISGTSYLPISLNPHGGNVGINTNNPTSALYVNGGITSTTLSTTGAITATGLINANGGINIGGSNNINLGDGTVSPGTGYLGQVIAPGAATTNSLAANTAKTIVTYSLTPGTWLIQCHVTFGTTASQTYIIQSLSTATNAIQLNNADNRLSSTTDTMDSTLFSFYATTGNKTIYITAKAGLACALTNILAFACRIA
jgi:hypothetical protein